jgi:hypothetical protein
MEIAQEPSKNHRARLYGCEPSMSNSAKSFELVDDNTVAKFLKCNAINFPQIDQTRAVDLTPATSLIFVRRAASQ